MTTAAAWPPAGRAWWAVSLCCAAALLSYTDRLILGLLVDPLRAELNIGDTEVSLLQGVAFALIYSFAGLPLGRLADSRSRRNLILAGVLLWSAATVACGLAQSFGQLFAARVLVGIGEAALAPAAMSLIADYFPPARRGTAVGTFLMGMVVGGGSALAVGGLLLQLANDGVFAGLPLLGALAPWRQVLVLLGVPGALMALLLLSLREPPRRERAAAAGLSWRETWQRLAQHRALLLPLYLAMALLSVGDFSLLNWSPALLSRRYGYAADELGLLLGGIAMATGVVATLGGGWLADRWGRYDGLRRRLWLACALAVLALPGTLIGLAGGQSGLALAAFGLWSLLSSAAGCVAIAVLQQVLPNELRGFGTALAAFGNILLGLGLGSSLTAALTDHVFADPTAVGWSISCVTLPAALAAALLLRHAAGVAARETPHD